MMDIVQRMNDAEFRRIREENATLRAELAATKRELGQHNRSLELAAADNEQLRVELTTTKQRLVTSYTEIVAELRQRLAEAERNVERAKGLFAQYGIGSDGKVDAYTIQALCDQLAIDRKDAERYRLLRKDFLHPQILRAQEGGEGIGSGPCVVMLDATLEHVLVHYFDDELDARCDAAISRREGE